MDLFFYGSQDVPPPPHGRRDRLPTRRGGEPSICESCSAPVSPDEIREGRATEVYGLVLCETCRLKARAEQRVELYFCDRCQVSVPVYRVDTGEALAGDGRILCLDCRRRPGRRWSTLVVLALAVVSLGFGTWLGASRFGARPEVREPDGHARVRALADRLEKAARHAPGLDRVEAGLEELAGLRERLLEQSATAEATALDLDRAALALDRTREELSRQFRIAEGALLTLLDEAEAALVAATTAER